MAADTNEVPNKERLGYLLARKQELLIRKGLASNIVEELVKKTESYRNDVKELKQHYKNSTEMRELAQKLYDVTSARVSSLSLAVKQSQMRLEKYKKIADGENNRKKDIDQKNLNSKRFKEKMDTFLFEFKKAPWIPEREKLSKELENERRNLDQIIETMDIERRIIEEKEAILKADEEIPFQKFCVQVAALAVKKRMLTKKLAVELVKYSKKKDLLDDSVLDVSIQPMEESQIEQETSQNDHEASQNDHESSPNDQEISQNEQRQETHEMEETEPQEMDSEMPEEMESEMPEDSQARDFEISSTPIAAPTANARDILNTSTTSQVNGSFLTNFNVNPAPPISSQDLLNMSLTSHGQNDFLANFGTNNSTACGSAAQDGDFFSFFGDVGSTNATQNQGDDFGFNFNLEMSEQDESAAPGGFSFNF